MLFLILSNVNINFLELKFFLKTYTFIKAILTTKEVEVVEKKEFVLAVLNSKKKTYVIHMASFASFNSQIYFFQKATIRVLKTTNILISVSNKYGDFINIFLSNLTTQNLEYIKINNYIIKLIDNLQLLYSFIYYLKPVKTKVLKIYIKINLVNDFIGLSNSLTRIFIFFYKKS